MKKKILSLCLCLLMILPMLASCGESDNNGAYITMYLTDDIYDLDPANAYRNENTENVVSMLFDTLFTLTEKGKVKNSLAESYKIYELEDEGEYYMEITLKTAYWSNGSQITADDVVFAWKRLLNSANSYEAASLLFDIKNARAVKNGDVSIDQLGVSAESDSIVKIRFEAPIDYDAFLVNLTSVATAPLKESYVTKTADWAKKSSTMLTSGAFKLSKIKMNDAGDKVSDSYALVDLNALKTTTYTSQKTATQTIKFFILERNSYYNRDPEKDDIAEAVTPYRILVDCTLSDEDLLQYYKDGKITYIGDIPLSIANDETIKANVTVTDANSTAVCYFNINADVKKGDTTEKLFSNEAVRKALSLCLDRVALAEATVYGEAATGLVAPGLTADGKDFRTQAGDILSTSADMAAAKKLLSDAGINPSDYTFKLLVSNYNEKHVALAEKVVEAWRELGFQCAVKKAETIQNNDYYKEIEQVDTTVCDDQLTDYFNNNDFDVILMDYVAYTNEAYSMLANFATEFAGSAIDLEDTTGTYQPNHSGYASEEYDAILEAIYYLPYFANLDRENDSDFLNIYATKEAFQKAYDSVKAVYDKYGITASTKESAWSEQEAKLLIEAEKILMEDMAIIPLVYNKNATVCSENLTKVKSTVYTPFDFTKAVLKDADLQYYTDEEDGKEHNVFEDFPTVDWDLVEAKKTTK